MIRSHIQRKLGLQVASVVGTRIEKLPAKRLESIFNKLNQAADLGKLEATLQREQLIGTVDGTKVSS